jgi:hypothetical protein
MVADRYFEREEAVAARPVIQWQSGCGGQPTVYCGQCGGVTEPFFLYEGQVRARVCTVCKSTRTEGT